MMASKQNVNERSRRPTRGFNFFAREKMNENEIIRMELARAHANTKKGE